MTARDAAASALDSAVGTVGIDGSTAAEVFSVVDLLDAQPMLRRSLSDPSSSDTARVHLADRLLGGKVSAATLEVVRAVVQAPWPSAKSMVVGLDRQGVRIALRAAADSGRLEEVEKDLFAVARIVDANPTLGAALRAFAYPLEARRQLVSSLIAGKVEPVAEQLALRAVSARHRTFQLTIEAYLEMAALMTGRKIARVRVARGLDEEQTSRLRSALEAQVNAPVTLQIEVDPSVLGGINVAIDDDVYESTVAARLEDARRQLINL